MVDTDGLVSTGEVMGGRGGDGEGRDSDGGRGGDGN